MKQVADALEELPTATEGWGHAEPPRPVRLPVFAGRVTGDPHAFDAETLASRLLERVILDSHPDPATLLAGVESLTLQRDLLFQSAGILRDDLSSFVLVWGLPASLDRQRLPSNFAFQLPLREVGRLLVQAGPHDAVFVVENPAVFGEIVDSLEATEYRGALDAVRMPIIVCTSGFPSLAALKLLDQLVELGTEIYYSGDFDENGLVIADSILRRYGEHAQPWRMSPADFARACAKGGGGIVLSAVEMERLAAKRTAFSELVAVMLQHGRKAFQEGIVEELVEDVVNATGWPG